MDEIKNEESWNKKRIFAALFLIVLLIIGGYFFKTRVLGTTSLNPLTSVKGVNTKENSINFNIPQTIKENINKLKQEVSGLNIVEVASSSPQVQKIINDIKSLEQYPTNQAKEICRKICGL